MSNPPAIQAHDARTNGANLRFNGHGVMPSHTAKVVDVVVPIYNALEFAKQCVASVLQHATPGLRVILVNDGSDEPTTSWLRDVSATADNVTLIEHDGNLGYTLAANSGLRASNADYVVLLNSDTVVTRDWLARLLRCAESASTIGIVGPLSNAASWQSVPAVKAGSSFATNPVPEGFGVDRVAELVASTSQRTYPRTPFVNGFCFLIKRAVIDAIGLLDEANFPKGYGEENDYCMRAAAAGFELAIADDAYVFHAKSKSFGVERRTVLVQAGSQALAQKYGADTVPELVKKARVLSGVEATRHALDAAFRDFHWRRVNVDPLGMRILFLLPVKGGGGGAHSVVQETTAMRRLGVCAQVAVRASDLPQMLKNYADIADAKDLFVGFTPDGLLDIAKAYDVVVATVFTSVELLERIERAFPEILLAYYIQDYEPLFFEEGTEQWRAARKSYQRVASAFCFAKTKWIAREVFEHHGCLVRKVEPSLDHGVYYPDNLDTSREIRIAAMVRPQTPRRAAARTMRVLAQVAARHADAVSIHIFGCDSGHPEFQELRRDFRFVNYGVLSRSEVASLLRRCDVFIDLSDYQAFGRTGLEAMASGCAVLLPLRGGADEYAVDGDNAVIVDTTDEAACVARLSALVSDRTELHRMRRRALATAATYSTHRAAVSELNLLAEGLATHREANPVPQRRRLFLVPERNERSQIGSAAHVRLINAWRHPEILRAWEVTVVSECTLPEPGSADVVIVQVGSAPVDSTQLSGWLADWRKSGGKLVVDPIRDENLPGTAPFSEQELKRVQWLASMADAVLVPTAALHEAFLPLNPSVFVVPSFLDSDSWRISPARTFEHPNATEPPAPIRLGFIGFDGDSLLLPPLAAAINRLQAEFGSDISVDVVGAYQNATPLFGQRVGLPRSQVYPDYVDWLHRRINWDIGLLPVPNDARNSQRALQKFLQYTALGVTTLASDTAHSRSFVESGRNGLLVGNDESSWYDGLRRLIKSGDLRKQLLTQAYADLNQHYTVEGNSRLYLATLDAIWSLPRRRDMPLDLGGRKVTSVAGVFELPHDGDLPLWTSHSDAQSVEPVVEGPVTDTSNETVKRAVFRRKLSKFARDPKTFFEDSRFPLAKSVMRLWGRQR